MDDMDAMDDMDRMDDCEAILSFFENEIEIENEWS
jgi:hypothetical protein